MIEPSTGIAQAGANILGFEIGEFLKHLFRRQSIGQQIKHIRYPDAHATNTRTTAALLWINSDTLNMFH